MHRQKQTEHYEWVYGVGMGFSAVLILVGFLLDTPREILDGLIRIVTMQDLLITDYSSSMFDMAVAGKKCVLYVPDLESYMSRERGLYFDITQLPFPRGETMEALCACVSDFEGYEDRCRAFLKEIRSFEDGNAAAAVAKRIERICND